MIVTYFLVHHPHFLSWSFRARKNNKDDIRTLEYLTIMAAKIYEQQNLGNKIKFIKKFVIFFQ